MPTTKYNVAIIGGGPGGSTCGGFLKKYSPDLKVGIFERELFPRDHVGESQLPVIGAMLAELGVWDKVEAADFPVKVGGTYRWGKGDELWDFHFLPNGEFDDKPRPGTYEGQRLDTAFQVDRSAYDKILLDHAKELGCEVFEGTGVTSIEKDGDKVTGITLKNGEKVEADFYIDATGHIGMLRRAMGVDIIEPSSLRNVAFWDYYQNAEWAVTLGVGGTRIQIMSVGYGWLWFIPISPTRTSLGFVCPADYYKMSGLKPEELFLKAVQDEPRIRALVANAEREGKFATTKDWSFLASRLAGPNWMLVGESAGFADPILSAGLSLTHSSAREAAFTIIEKKRGGDYKWLVDAYSTRNYRRVMQHIRFADYWYKANRHFDDLKEYTREIAKDAGLDLDAEAAFRWLGAGGFIEEDIGVGGFGTVSFNALHQIANRLSDKSSHSALAGYNCFLLNLKGAHETAYPHYEAGRVYKVKAYERDGKVLPLSGMVAWAVRGLEINPVVYKAAAAIKGLMAQSGIEYSQVVHDGLLETLEAMMRDGWIKGKTIDSEEPLPELVPTESSMIKANQDEKLPGSRKAKAIR